MTPTLAASITKSASRQTYYTIRFLADRDRVEDAFRAYAYYRWVDDSLDSTALSISERNNFLLRQKNLLNTCLDGGQAGNPCPEERLMVDLTGKAREKNTGLRTYLQDMMSVMEIDAGRRGEVITQAELNRYTHLLSSAVTEAMHYFVGNGCFSPRDDTRYLAVAGAHLTHMLRDAVEDACSGYYNIPAEYLAANRITPHDFASPAYRAWVRSRVQQARQYFQAGRGYLRRVENPRCRFAGFAYQARFERVLDMIERDEFLLRGSYEGQGEPGKSWSMIWTALWLTLRRGEPLIRESSMDTPLSD